MKISIFNKMILFYLAVIVLVAVCAHFSISYIVNEYHPLALNNNPSVLSDDMSTAMVNMTIRITAVVVIILLIAGAVSIWQLSTIRRFMNQLSEYAGALSHGLFRKGLILENAGKFSDLAESLNDISSTLKSDKMIINEDTNRLNVILKSIPDALLITNTDGAVEIANSKARELFGNPALVGKNIHSIVSSQDILSLIERVRKSRKPESVELIFDTPQQKILFVWLSPLSYTIGELSGFVALFHDISDFKKLEQVRKDFVANVSHEIKTPVTSIKGYAETLLDGALYDKEHAEKFLVTIKAHSERLNRLVEDLLILSRLELGVAKVNKSRCYLADILNSVAGMMDIQAAEKGVVIKKSYEAEDITANVDRDKTEQVLLNLLDNAIKFTEKGEITIGIASVEAGHCFFVRDTGVGIPRESLSRLGERFYRVDTSRSRELGGTGLGLAIVKHIVKAQGWEMKIESESGKGTEVKVLIKS